jgi:uncharacterized membrane protein
MYELLCFDLLSSIIVMPVIAYTAGMNHLKMKNGYSFTDALSSSVLTNVLKMILNRGLERMWRDTMAAC